MARRGANRAKIHIEADNEMRQGHYSNLAFLSHREEEFIIDFLFVDPQIATCKGSEAVLVSRVILNAKHMKRLRDAIHEHVAKYEEAFSEVAKEGEE